MIGTTVLTSMTTICFFSFVRFLSFGGLDLNNCVVALGTCNAPMLQELDLSYVAGLNDVALYKILSAPKDSRPGNWFTIVIEKLFNVKETLLQKLRSFW